MPLCIPWKAAQLRGKPTQTCAASENFSKAINKPLTHIRSSDKDFIVYKHLINSIAECSQCNLIGLSLSLYRYL